MDAVAPNPEPVTRMVTSAETAAGTTDEMRGACARAGTAQASSIVANATSRVERNTEQADH